jgi:hypothetical protein
MEFKTYCLSLKKCTDRREWMLSNQKKMRLDFEFFDAVTPDEITDDIVKRYFSDFSFYDEWDVNKRAIMATFISHMKLLELSANTKQNILIIEDDILIVRPYKWNDVDFDKFDILKLTHRGNFCYSYFVSHTGATNVLEYLNRIEITQGYDHELEKCRELNIITEERPVFIQTPYFQSNIAPNGYKKL